MGQTEVDQLLDASGNPGLYSWILFELICLNYLPVAFNHLAMSIYAATPQYACHLPDDIPANNMSVPEKNGRLDSCSVYANYTYTSGETVRCTSWEYTLIDGESTIVNEWNLICHDKYVPNLATTVYFAGVMLGGLLCGHLADLIGPRTTLLVTLYTSVLLGVMVYLVQSIKLFMFLRFFIGFVMQGLQISVFVLAVELCVTSKNRALTAALFEGHWAVGVMILGGIAYIFKAWRDIQLAISLIVLLSLTFIWFIPESFRWLINHQRYKESLSYLKKAAEINKVVLAPGTERTLHEICTRDLGTEKEGRVTYTLWHAFKRPNLRKHTLVMFYVWLATSLGYYGLSLQASSFTGNKYLNFVINGAIELPAYVMAIWILGYIGRRLPLCLYFLIGGIACVIAGTIPEQTGGGSDIAWISTMFAWMGKFATAGCWSVLFLYGSEIFPGAIRNAGLGACSFWSRVGSLIAPQINLISKYSRKWIPFVIFGIVMIIGSLLALLLPETKNESLPETFEEAERLGESHRKKTNNTAKQQDVDSDIPEGTRL